MPFQIAPSRISGQPGFMFDEDERLRCLYDSSLYRWVIVDTEHATPVVKVGEERTLALMPFLYNDQPVWRFSGAVFNSVTDGWIYNPSGIYEPSAEKDIDGETWIGDGWWKAGKPNPKYPEIVCEPRGTYLNDGAAETPPTLLWWWPRWEWTKDLSGRSQAPWGVYAAKDGAEAVCARRILGLQQYRDNKRNYWTLAQNRLSLSCTDGRIIRYNDSDRVWVLGVRGVGKWLESANGPDRESGMTLAPWKHDAETGEDVPDSDAEPLVLSFNRFVASEGTDRIYMAEVALWH